MLCCLWEGEVKSWRTIKRGRRRRRRRRAGDGSCQTVRDESAERSKRAPDGGGKKGSGRSTRRAGAGRRVVMERKVPGACCHANQGLAAASFVHRKVTDDFQENQSWGGNWFVSVFSLSPPRSRARYIFGGGREGGKYGWHFKVEHSASVTGKLLMKATPGLRCFRASGASGNMDRL